MQRNIFSIGCGLIPSHPAQGDRASLGAAKATWPAAPKVPSFLGPMIGSK